MSHILYSLRDVTQLHGGNKVLNVPTLDIPSGSITGITGPNGCGKTTLMRILAFLEAPASGCIDFDGAPCFAGTNDSNRDVTLLVQEPYLLKRSVYANVAFGLKVRGEHGIENKVNEALTMVGLEPHKFASRSWHQLSGGEAQRVALAARLAFRPKVLLLDEPNASLDKKSSEIVKDTVMAAREKFGTTLVIVSHDIEWLQSISDTMYFMRGGRFVDSPSTSIGG